VTLTREQVTAMREDLKTEEGALNAALSLVDVGVERGRADLGEVTSLVRWMAQELATNNMRTIYAHAESPIEQLLFASLALGFLITDPFGATFRPPSRNAPRDITLHREGLARARSWWDTYTKKGSTVAFAEWLEGQQTVSEEELIQYSFERQLRLHHTWRLTIQAGFPNLVIERKSLRADLLAWIPETADPGVVVECDGFAYHAGKEAFIRDRKRDRLLHRHGYRVLRFAGTELHNDPSGTAMELFDALRRLHKELLPTGAP